MLGIASPVNRRDILAAQGHQTSCFYRQDYEILQTTDQNNQ